MSDQIKAGVPAVENWLRQLCTDEQWRANVKTQIATLVMLARDHRRQALQERMRPDRSAWITGFASGASCAYMVAARRLKGLL